MILRIAAIFAMVATGAWALTKPDWDSICAALAALAALVAAFVHKSEAPQAQTVGPKGVGVQAGRDVSIRDISNQ